MNSTINVKVIANAKINKIEKQDDGLKIHLMTLPVKGKANKELIKMIAKFYGIKKREVALVHGHTSQNKVFKINTVES